MNNIIISENGIDPRGRVRRMAALLAALLVFSAFMTSCGGNGDNVTEDGTRHDDRRKKLQPTRTPSR